MKVDFPHTLETISMFFSGTQNLVVRETEADFLEFDEYLEVLLLDEHLLSVPFYSIQVEEAAISACRE